MQRSGTLGIVVVLTLVCVTLYMAFAFPYTLLHLKQSETTEIKSVILVARNGERTPSSDAYFIGEDLNAQILKIGQDQLTSVGKERMYLLGKFLRLKYYNLLLNGNPRKVYARSADSDRCLESAQALLAGLLPPKDNWLWSSSGGSDWLPNWQPKAIHSADLRDDDLLSSQATCFKFDQTKLRWKNSTKYQQLLNEFRHDLQTLRLNTGLEFEDDLEMVSSIEDSLSTRLAFDESDVPAWYTTTFASRLSHIVDVSVGSRFSQPEAQRLHSGRLLHEIIENINNRIKLDKVSLVMENLKEDGDPEKQADQQQQLKLASSKSKSIEPNMFIYMTDKQHLNALMSSLQIYSTQPQFGSLLLIELHRDPINQVYFLRLFTISSTSPNVFPEPVRVNPIACVDSAECEPQQFEQNTRHLTLDKSAWQKLCAEHMGAPMTPTASTTSSPAITTQATYLEELIQQDKTTTSTAAPSETPVFETTSPVTEATTSTPMAETTATAEVETTTKPAEPSTPDSEIEELDQSLIVGPTEFKSTTTTRESLTSESEVTDTTAESTATSNPPETTPTPESARPTEMEQTTTKSTSSPATDSKGTTTRGQDDGSTKAEDGLLVLDEKQPTRTVYYADNQLE